MHKPTPVADNLRRLRERKYTQREATPEPGPIHRRMAALAGQIANASARADANVAKKAARKAAKKKRKPVAEQP